MGKISWAQDEWPLLLQVERWRICYDNAIVSFNESTALPKFRFGDHAEICIPQGNDDYAIAYSDKQGEMPLNFKALYNLPEGPGIKATGFWILWK